MSSMGNPGFFGFMDQVPLFIIIIFTLIIGIFVVGIIKGLMTWSSNNAAELIAQPCKVVDKRTEVEGGSGDSSARTNYYITFEFEDTTRKEWRVRANEYGLITVGDHGELIYQGTRFKQFIRQTGSELNHY